MGLIKRLDQHTTNLIAAGEVIEKPASVVKELVENAIDAKATNITITLADSGLSEIVVSDNGIGMDSVDAKMAIEPHATSKISSSDDLFHINTLGFRGEALPSIVSVSHFNLKTSNTGGKGLMYTVKGGTLVSEAIISHPKGTEITVKNLFFNVPARLQNVKSQPIELAAVTDYVTKTALAYPNISFTLTNNNRDIVRTYGNGDLLEVILAIYGSDVAKQMIKIFENNGYFTIDGYISKIAISRSTKNHIALIVNGRPIKNNNLINAIMKGYDEFLVLGHYPIVVLNINVDPGLVDVNVHPAKLEVRFSEETKLQELISTTIHNALSKVDLIVPLDNKVNITKNNDDEFNEEKSNEFAYHNDDEIVQEKQDSDSVNDELHEDPFINFAFSEPEKVEEEKFVLKETEIIEKEKQEVFSQQKYTFFENDYGTDSKVDRLPKMSYIGQLHGTYILAQSEEEFFIIDQHAAAERINYEKIIDDLKRDEIVKYELLVPLKLDFPQAEAILINEQKETLNKLGITIEDFGGGSYLVREVPIWIKKGNEKIFVEEIITQVINNKKKEKYEFLTSLAKSLACKKSIKGNEYHNQFEIEYLLEDLRRARNPYTCPHGRPVIVKFNKYEIEKWFKRVV